MMPNLKIRPAHAFYQPCSDPVNFSYLFFKNKYWLVYDQIMHVARKITSSVSYCQTYF